MRRVVPATILAVTLCLAACGHGSTTARPAPSVSPAPTESSGGRSPSSDPAPTHVTATTVSWRLTVPSARQALIPLGGTKVMVAGGMLAGDSSTAEVRRIDLSTGRSRPAPQLAVPVHDAAGGPYAGHPAVFGGGNASEQSLVQSLVGTRWRRVDAFPTTRSDLSVVRLPGSTLALGGYDGTAVPRPIYLQHGAHGLRQVGRLVQGVRYAATAAVGSAVYVFGGEVDHAELSAVQRVDVPTGRTRVVARLPRALGHAMAATVSGRVLLMGGHPDPVTRTRAIWWFDPATARFTRAGRLPRALSDAAVAVTGSTVWLLGGEDPGVTDRVVRLDVR
jgi:hypothetical protein